MTMHVLELHSIDAGLAARLPAALVAERALEAGAVIGIRRETVDYSGAEGAPAHVIADPASDGLVLVLPDSVVRDWGLTSSDQLVVIGDRIYVDTRAAAAARPIIEAAPYDYAGVWHALGDD